MLVPVVCLVAGFGFAASAHDSQGTDLRPPGTANLSDLVRAAEAQVRTEDAHWPALQQQVEAATEAGRRHATRRSPPSRPSRRRCANRAG